MEGLQWETAEELNQKLAGRIRTIRRRRAITQKQLSTRSGVSYASIRRFEETGQISLLSLTKISLALGISDELRELFARTPYMSIEEVIREKREHA